MVAENPTWGAPRIHGKLLKLGFDLSERSVSRWIRRAPRDPDPVKEWLAFLRNHREAIAAMDFFTVSTLTFGVLYCFFVIGHDRRKILHFNVTSNPHALWVVQQLREAWAYQQTHRFLLLDRDAKFGADVVSAVRDIGSEPTRTAFCCSWQNGVAERWIGNCRRDLLNHVIILSERHLKRLLSSYLLYYHEDRTHLGLAKDTPAGRATEIRSASENKIQSFPRPGGLHHRYAVRRGLKSNRSEDQTLLLETRTGTVPIFCELLSPGDESACHPKPRYLCQVERNPCDAGVTIWRPQLDIRVVDLVPAFGHLAINKSAAGMDVEANLPPGRGYAHALLSRVSCADVQICVRARYEERSNRISSTIIGCGGAASWSAAP